MDKTFLKNYLNGVSPSGYEMILGGQKIWVDYVKQYATKVETDDYGNAYAYFGNMNSDITILLDAHADEIGFVVKDITKEGFIKVVRLGGSDITITPSTRVNIWGDKKVVKGVFGHPAIHIQEVQFVVDKNKIFVDIGVDSKEKVIKKGINIGTPITLEGDFITLGDFYCGKSLDDKIGGFVNSMVLRHLYTNNIQLPYQLVVVNAVQEEVGLFGAQMVVNHIKPNVAIAIDVTHDTKNPADTGKNGSTHAGLGVSICDAPSIQKNLFKLLKDTANIEKIDYQLEVSGGGSGTNADSYAYPYGIPTALLSIPMRYMHTTVESVHKKDVEGAIKLLVALLQREEIYKSFKYE